MKSPRAAHPQKLRPTQKSKKAANHPTKGFEFSDEDRATLEDMAARYGFGDDVAEFCAQLMAGAFED
jgi:hypothetical protein